jgi:hypothetical protein
MSASRIVDIQKRGGIGFPNLASSLSKLPVQGHS